MRLCKERRERREGEGNVGISQSIGKKQMYMLLRNQFNLHIKANPTKYELSSALIYSLLVRWTLF